MSKMFTLFIEIVIFLASILNYYVFMNNYSFFYT